MDFLSSKIDIFMAGRKSTRAEYNERLSYTANLLGKGFQRYEIVENLMNTYKISIQMADKMIGDVYESMRQTYPTIGEELMVIYKELMKEADLQNNTKLKKEIQIQLLR